MTEQYTGTQISGAQQLAASLIGLQKNYDTRIARLEQEIEDLRDAMDLMAAIERGEETFPSDVMERLVIDRENPVKVFREYRGMTQTQLAKKSGVRQAMLSEIESKKKKGSIATLKALAEALELTIDDLV